MADSDLRELERRYRETLQAIDHALWLEARVRAGLLSERAVELAARLGAPGAQIARWGEVLPNLGPILDDLRVLEVQTQDAVADQRFEHASVLRATGEALRAPWEGRAPLPRPIGLWPEALAEDFPESAQGIGLALARWFSEVKGGQVPGLRQLERRVLERGGFAPLEEVPGGLIRVLKRLITSFGGEALGAAAYRAVAAEVVPWTLGPAVTEV